jgi:hypothetical protein
VLIVAVTLLITATASNAFVQGGRRSASGNPDGVRADIEGSSFSPETNHCLVFDVVLSDNVVARQVETGYLRCNGSGYLDNGCTDSKYVERIAGSNYNCWMHGSFTNGAFNTFAILRDSAGSDKYHAYINGTVQEGGAGFSGQDTIFGWGENTNPASGSSPCGSWGGVGYFSQWNKFNYGSGWASVTGNAFGPCWSTSTINQYGVFSVSY